MRVVVPAVVVIAIVLGVLVFFAETRPVAPYRLAVVLVVDQMRSDYLTRFNDDFQFGLRRLLDNGVHFTEAYHNHAATETGVGHATIGTGMTPSHHGIIGNGWYDRRDGRSVYCSEDSTVRIIGHPEMEGRSPRRMAMPAVGDWLKKRSPQSKVVSMSLKDRAAIGMGGHSADAVYWYSRNDGSFVTSTFYMDTTPTWVDSFNFSEAPDSYLEEEWFGDNPEGSFGHPFDTAGAGMRNYYRSLYTTPFGDLLMLDFARVAIDHMTLGEDDIPDILFISCSTSDVIGHAYGPDSPEVRDFYRRLDAKLPELLNHLDETVGENNYFVILASDHGVMPLPEVLSRHGVDARRISPRLVDSTLTAIAESVEKRMHFDGDAVKIEFDGLVIDTARLRASGVDPLEVQMALAVELRKAFFLADVYTTAELLDSSTPDRPYMNLYRNNIFPGRGCDVLFRYLDNTLITDDSTGTTHGSPYRDDTHVPIVISRPGQTPSICEDSVRTVDIAPTVFDLLGYDTPEFVDGRSLMSHICE